MEEIRQHVRFALVQYTVASLAPLVSMGIMWLYPTASSAVNGGLQYGLGNETTYQIPKTVDEVVVKTMTFGVTETSWTFRIFAGWMTFMGIFGYIMQIMQFVMQVLTFMMTVGPWIAAVAMFFGGMIKDVGVYLYKIIKYITGALAQCIAGAFAQMAGAIAECIARNAQPVTDVQDVSFAQPDPDVPPVPAAGVRARAFSPSRARRVQRRG
jgi:hypothetical protein